MEFVRMTVLVEVEGWSEEGGLGVAGAGWLRPVPVSIAQKDKGSNDRRIQTDSHVNPPIYPFCAF